MRCLGVPHDLRREAAVGSLPACSGLQSLEVGWDLRWELALGKWFSSGQSPPPMALEHLHERPSGALPVGPPVQASRHPRHRYQL